MLKDIDKYENTHFSYEEYKKKKNKAPNKYIVVFTSVFFIGLLLILGMVKILSPNVDVGLGDEYSYNSEEDDNDLPSAIDERLKRIQMEDEGKKLDDEEIFSPELDERVVIPNTIRKTTGEIEAEANEKQQTQTVEQKVIQVQKVQETQPIQPQPKEEKVSAPAPSQIVNAKVVVGYYATEKQAEVAKSIIQDAGLGVTPIVKNLGGYYTLQVGSYSSREKAQQAANNLLRSNFPARVIVE
ncbi:SPOR domain-containing protein [bacterium]|nr:SPOR domain-containing protein [bacterium]